jgi:hypothetical protein
MPEHAKGKKANRNCRSMCDLHYKHTQERLNVALKANDNVRAACQWYRRRPNIRSLVFF